MDGAHTAPIDINGRTSDLETQVGLALPDQVTATGSPQIKVAVTIVEDTGTRTFPVGIGLVGARPDRLYVLGPTSVNVTLGGPCLSSTRSTPTALGGAPSTWPTLDVGVHTVPLDFAPPGGLQVVTIAPPNITVTVQAAVGRRPSASP